MILEKAFWYLNSSAKQTHSSLQRSFRLAPVTLSISLSCVRARAVTYYTEVFSGTWLKCRYLTTWVDGSTWATLFVSCLQSQGCVWTPDCFFSAHTERKASGPWGDILWIWQKVYWIRIVDYTFSLSVYEQTTAPIIFYQAAASSCPFLESESALLAHIRAHIQGIWFQFDLNVLTQK